MAAGTLATPTILEASGVGNRPLLTRLGIEIRVDLHEEGENFQGQPDLTLSYSPQTSTPGVFTPYAAFVTAKDVFRDKTEDIAAYVSHELIKQSFKILSLFLKQCSRG